jgi:cytidylate kinase
MKINDILCEGVNDPHIFKAVFLAGGPGSGKSFVSNTLLKHTGLRTVNSDDIYEYMMTKAGMTLDPETIFSPAGQATRERAKGITQRKQQSHIDGRLGLIIDGTGKDVAKYAKTKKMLEDLGYDTMMLFVNTGLEVAQQRNLMRARSLDPKVVEKMWNAVQQNIMGFQQLFGAQNFYVIDNSGGLEDPDRKENFQKVSKAIDRFINQKPSRPAANRWLAAQKAKPQISVTEADSRPITTNDLKKLEFYADKIFRNVGIDVEFTHHFLDRVNDQRNVRQITLPELAVLFRDQYQRWGKRIAQLGPEAEAVMKDMRSDINVPFVLKWDSTNQELDLVAKTVMRKRGFKTPDQEFAVESNRTQQNEVLDTKATDAKWTMSSEDMSRLEFTASNGIEYQIDFLAPYIGPDEIQPDDFIPNMPRDAEDSAVFVEFSQKNATGAAKQGVAGTGAAAEIFGIVTNAILDFAKKRKPSMIYFQAAEVNRRKLYAAIVRRLVSSMPGYVVKQIGDKFAVYRQKLATATENRHPDQLRGSDRPKMTKPSATGSQPHPFRGKLVGNNG